MEFKSLEDKLSSLIALTDLPAGEQDMLLRCYLKPGMDSASIKGLGGSSDILNEMIKKGLLMKCSEEKKIYPVPLSILSDKHSLHDEKTQKSLQNRLSEIDQWIEYPLMRQEGTRFTTLKGSAARKWIFDLLTQDWETVLCFGDYESFIAMFGLDVEREWIQERIKRGKRASVLATQDGEFARDIDKLSHNELRNCLINPTEFSDLFIMTFPEVHTTVIAKKTGEITFVHSTNVAMSYSRVVTNTLEMQQ